MIYHRTMVKGCLYQDFKKEDYKMKKDIEIGEDNCAKLKTWNEAPTSLEEEKHFHEVNKNSWEIRVAWLIHFMI